MGKAYVLTCLLGGIAGLYIAQHASEGWITRLGFSLLAVLWLYSTIRALIHVRRGDIPRHQIWMLRSYALTLAAVTLRLYLGPMMAFGVEFSTAYKIVAWACWIPNLMIVELFFTKKLREPGLKEPVRSEITKVKSSAPFEEVKVVWA